MQEERAPRETRRHVSSAWTGHGAPRNSTPIHTVVRCDPVRCGPFRKPGTHRGHSIKAVTDAARAAASTLLFVQTAKRTVETSTSAMQHACAITAPRPGQASVCRVKQGAPDEPPRRRRSSKAERSGIQRWALPHRALQLRRTHRQAVRCSEAKPPRTACRTPGSVDEKVDNLHSTLQWRRCTRRVPTHRASARYGGCSNVSLPGTQPLQAATVVMIAPAARPYGTKHNDCSREHRSVTQGQLLPFPPQQ